MNIPTAENFFNLESDKLNSDKNDIPKWMINSAIEFAKLHVKAALKAATKVDFDDVGFDDIANDYEEARDMAIEASYLLENIK